MARILVIGSVNLDRVWRLTAPLRPGGRLYYEAAETRCGGGGYYTGTALAALGHQVQLMTSLPDDAPGQRRLALIGRLGLDTSLVRLVAGRSQAVEILVDPMGERTIIGPRHSHHLPIDAVPPTGADLVYLNVRQLRPEAGEALLARQPVVAQFPLAEGERRPAQVLIASQADLPADPGPTLFAEAQRRSGPGLRMLVLTAGAAPTRVIDAAGDASIAVAACPPTADTIGAGDVFAAGFIDGYLSGASPAEAAARGNQVAGQFLRDRSALVPAGRLD